MEESSIGIDHGLAARILHTMLRVNDIDVSIKFYTKNLGMKFFRKENYPDGRFTLAFVGYGDEDNQSIIELTQNWDAQIYEKGNAWGHIAIGVLNAKEAVKKLRANGVTILRDAAPMTSSSQERELRGLHIETIAFIEDPDGYRIELIEEKPRG